jgi:hypothetical protein
MKKEQKGSTGIEERQGVGIRRLGRPLINERSMLQHIVGMTGAGMHKSAQTDVGTHTFAHTAHACIFGG